MSCHSLYCNNKKRQHSHFPCSSAKGYHCSYLMGQLSDILRMSPAHFCAAISISYLKSYEECFVVKVNLVVKKIACFGICACHDTKGKRTLMIHFNNVFFSLNPAGSERRAGEEDARGRLTSDCLMACKGVRG